MRRIRAGGAGRILPQLSLLSGLQNADAVDFYVVRDGDGEIFDPVDKACADHIGHLRFDGDPQAGGLDLQLFDIRDVFCHQRAAFAYRIVKGLVKGLE